MPGDHTDQNRTLHIIPKENADFTAAVARFSAAAAAAVGRFPPSPEVNHTL